MTQRRLLNLTLARKTLLAGAAMGACALPLVIGILRAQTLPPPPAYRYDVASVKPSAVGARGSGISPGPQGGLRSRNTTAIQLVTFAYHVQQYQVLGAPGWADADRFDVSFTPEKEDPRPGLEADLAKREGHSTRNRHRLRAVLRDRFGLVMRSEIREMPIYALTWVKNAKNRPTPASEAAPFNLMASSGTISAKSGSMPMLAVLLSDFLGRTVIDETGMAGVYDMELTFATDAAIQMRRKPGADAPPQPVDNGAPTIFTALTEQLGLRLESKKGPVQVYVIEKLEKPSAN